jgi:hypothetical protein
MSRATSACRYSKVNADAEFAGRVKSAPGGGKLLRAARSFCAHDLRPHLA